MFNEGREGRIGNWEEAAVLKSCEEGSCHCPLRHRGVQTVYICAHLQLVPRLQLPRLTVADSLHLHSRHRNGYMMTSSLPVSGTDDTRNT